MRRIARRIFLAVLIIAVMMVLLVAFIWYSPGASQFVVRKAIAYSPIDIQVASIEGSFNQGLTLHQFHVTTADTSVDIAQLGWQWSGFDWSKKIVSVDWIEVEDLTVTVTTSDSSEKASGEFKGMMLPVGLVIDDVHLRNTRLITNGEEQVFEKIQFGLRAIDDQVAMSAIDVQRQALNITGDANATLSDSLPFSFEHRVSWLQTPTALTVNGIIDGDLSRVHVADVVHFEQQDQVVSTLTMNGDIDLQQGSPLFDFTVTAPAIEIKTSPEKAINLTDIDIHLTGGIDDYAVAANWSVNGDDIPEAQMQLEAEGDTRAFQVSSLLTQTLQGSVNTSATITWEETIGIATSTTLEKLNPGVEWAEWPGDINGDIDVAISLVPEQPVQVDISTLALQGTLRDFPVNLQADALITPDKIQVNNANLRVASNQVNARATYQQDTMDAQFDTDIVDLGQILPEASGALTMQGNVVGRLSEPRVDASISGSGLGYKQYSVASLQAQIKSDKNAIWAINAQASDIQNEQPLAQQLTLAVNGAMDNHQASLTAELPALTMRLGVSGSWISSTLSGELLSNTVTLKEPQQTWQLVEPVTASYDAKRSELGRACWQLLGNPGNVCTQAEMSTDNALRVDAGVVIDRFDIRAVESWLPNDLRLAGLLDGEGALAYTPGSWSLDANLALGSGSIDYNPVNGERYKTGITTATLQSKTSDDTTTMDVDIELADGSTSSLTMQVEGTPETDMRLAGDFNAKINNTQYLAALSPEIEALTGSLNTRVNVGGTIKQPLLNAEASLQSIRLARTQTTLDNIELTIDQTEPQRYKLNLVANSGEGTIKTAGVLRVPDMQNWELQATLKGTDFEALRLAEIELDLSPDLLINANNTLINITGDVLIPYGLVDIKQLPPRAITSSSDVVIHTDVEVPEKASPIDVAFTINTRIEEAIQFNALGFESTLSGGLKVRKPAKDNVIRTNGRLQINEGKYELYGQKLAIKNGELLFNGPINNPGIDVKATRTSQDGDVIAGIRFGGTINNLQSELYSEPSLPEADVLAYLLTGQALGSSSEFGGDQLLQAAVLLGLKKNGSLLTQLQTSLGVDVLTINEGNNTGESAIEAGKFLSDDFYIGYSYGLFNRVGFWLVNYQLTEALRLESRYGEQQSIDVMYSIERD